MIIPVVMMFNNNYAIPSGPAIYSMLLHADKQHFYNLFIMHNDISSENQDKIRQIVEMFSNASLKFLEMNNKFSEYAHLTKYPVEILYKLCLETQFPNMDKIILTDVDVVFEGDISKEYINFTTDEYFAGVKQVQEIQRKPFSQDITDDNMHFLTGAGYLIMNLKKMREDNIENKCLRMSLSFSSVFQKSFKETAIFRSLSDKFAPPCQMFNVSECSRCLSA